MYLENLQRAAVIASLFTWSVMGIARDVTSASSWMVMIGAGVLSPLLFLRMWHLSGPTLSGNVYHAV